MQCVINIKNGKYVIVFSSILIEIIIERGIIVKKQTIWIIVIVAVVLFLGVVGIFSSILFSSLVSVGQSAGSTSYFAYDDSDIVLPIDDFVGVVNIVGQIGPTSTGLFTSVEGYDHDLNMDFVDAMIYADNNKGILLYVDSPGGTVYESDELYLKLMEYKEKTNRPIWAYFASEACSGGYYISMASDRIYANRNCTTGSIGVIISTINMSGLYEKIGIEEVNIVSGGNKAMGSSGKPMTEDQIAIYQSVVDESYEQFVDIVCDGRNLDKEVVKRLADGRIYTAKQALDNKLIDNIGLYDDFVNDMTKECGFADYITYYDPQSEMTSVFGGLFAAINDLIPRSDAEIAEKIANDKNSGTLMYMAN